MRHVHEEPAGRGQERRVRRAHVPQRGAEQVDLAELAGPDPLGRRGPVRVEPAVEADLERHAGRGHRGQGVHSGRSVERDRLLAEHRPAGPGGPGDQLGVRAGRRRDHDGVHIGQQRVEVRHRRHADARRRPRPRPTGRRSASVDRPTSRPTDGHRRRPRSAPSPWTARPIRPTARPARPAAGPRTARPRRARPAPARTAARAAPQRSHAGPVLGRDQRLGGQPEPLDRVVRGVLVLDVDGHVRVDRGPARSGTGPRSRRRGRVRRGRTPRPGRPASG